MDIIKPVKNLIKPEPEIEDEEIETPTSIEDKVEVPNSPEKIVGIQLQSFEWEAPEFDKQEKSKSWFVIPAIVTIIVGIIAIATDNILLLILILMAFFMIYVYAKKEPRVIKFRIDEKGIEIDEKLHDFSSLKSFWMFYDPPTEKEISLRSRKVSFPYIRIPLAEQNPNEIRKYLLRFLPERRHKESLIDVWMRRIGF